MDENVDPTCRLCAEEAETPEHLFFDCPWVIEDRELERQTIPTHDGWSIKQLEWLLSRQYIKEMMDPELEQEMRQRELEEEEAIDEQQGD